MSSTLETASTAPVPDLEAKDLLDRFDDGPGLAGTRCSACDKTMLGVRVVCSSCVGTDVHRVCLSRQGRLYTFTRLHLKGTVRTIGYVDLDNGVRTLADIREKGHELRPDLAVALGVEGEQWFFTPDPESGDNNV